MSYLTDVYVQMGQVEPEPEEEGDVEPEPVPEPDQSKETENKLGCSQYAEIIE